MKEIRRSETNTVQYDSFKHYLVGFNRCNNLTINVSIKGHMDYDMLKAAIRKVMENHESFRAGFEYTGDNFYYIVYDELRSTIEMQEAEGADEAEKFANVMASIGQMQSQTVDPFKDQLAKAVIYRISDEYNIVSFCVNHMVSDGYSQYVLMNELLACLTSDTPLQPEALSYCDYCDECKAYLESDEGKESAEFWRNNMMRYSSELMPEHQGKRKEKTGVPKLRKIIGADIKQKIMDYSKKNGVSEFTIIEAAYQLCVARFNNTESPALMITFANRNDVRTANAVGLYADGYLSIAEYQEDQKVADFIRSRLQSQSEYEKHLKGHDCRLTSGYEDTRKASTPYMISYINFGNGALTNGMKIGDYTVQTVVPEIDSYYPQMFFIIGLSSESAIAFELTYDLNLFADDYAQEFLDALEEMIVAIADEKAETVSELVEGV